MIVKVTGGLAMACRHLGYGKRIDNASTKRRDGSAAASMQYEIDNTTQEFALVAQQAQEWRTKGNENMRKNAEAVRDEVRSLREIVEKLVQMNGHGQEAPSQVTLTVPVKAPPPPPPKPPAETEMAPEGSVWRTRPWNQPRGPRWLEVLAVHRGHEGKWMVDVFVIGGHQRNRTLELGTLLSHWERQDAGAPA
jgi:hypothetical protein